MIRVRSSLVSTAEGVGASTIKSARSAGNNKLLASAYQFSSMTKIMKWDARHVQEKLPR